MPTELNMDDLRAKALAAKKRDPKQEKARSMVRCAVARGDLVRPEACEMCLKIPGRGRDGRVLIQGHHHLGYDRPLDVQWICTTCHRRETPCNPLRGERSVSAKLTEADVAHIRSKATTQVAYAKIYGVDQTLISQIQLRKGWAHVA